MESVNLIHPNNVSLFEGIYRNKKGLITGNTGLKSSWVSVWKVMLGAKEYGLSKGMPTKPSDFETADSRDNIFEKVVRDSI